MNPMRVLLLLALATVLSGVPSPAFAASNELNAADAQPRSGTTLTPFTLSVEYHGGFPAVLVTADVAGRILPMLLASGSLLDGRWSTSAVLPSGTWTVRFVADASLGNDPSLDGPSLTVQGISSPTPAPSSGSNGPGPAPTSTDTTHGGGGGAGDPSPTQAPAAPAEPAAPAGPNASDAALPAAATEPAPAGSTPSDVWAGAAEPTAAAAVIGPSSATMGSPAPTMSSSAAEAAPHDTANERVGGSGAAPDSMDEPSWAALPIAAGLAALAILATFVGLARRRRRPAAEPPSASVAPSVEDEVTAALHRRTLRRSRRRLDEDPIVTALGVNETPPTTRMRGGKRRPPAD